MTKKKRSLIGVARCRPRPPNRNEQAFINLLSYSRTLKDVLRLFVTYFLCLLRVISSVPRKRRSSSFYSASFRQRTRSPLFTGLKSSSLPGSQYRLSKFEDHLRF